MTQLKGKGAVQYVGVATGMNSLIRPALYGAHHDIVNLTRLGEPGTEVYNVVGPICESADYFGHERLLPPTEEGDVLLIANAGAYGRGDEFVVQPARAGTRSAGLTRAMRRSGLESRIRRLARHGGFGAPRSACARSATSS